jgi:hypothetical protein
MTELNVIKLVNWNPLTGILERVGLMLEIFFFVNSVRQLNKPKSSLNMRITIVIITKSIKIVILFVFVLVNYD